MNIQAQTVRLFTALRQSLHSSAIVSSQQAINHSFARASGVSRLFERLRFALEALHLLELEVGLRAFEQDGHLSLLHCPIRPTHCSTHEMCMHLSPSGLLLTTD
eukprot:6210446-Pleurochrysis_carterae.AAC.3